MRKFFLLLLASISCFISFAQSGNLDSLLTVHKAQRDSTLRVKDSIHRAAFRADSLAVEKEYKEGKKWDSILARAQYPVIRAGDWSGIIPVPEATEKPDPTLNYKFLFELTSLNPDSAAKEVDYGLSEVARVINLHVASGVPLKKISVVIVIHAAALKAFGTNAYYKEKFKTDNPNIKVVEDLKKLGVGAKFIACGQAMNFIGIKKEEMLPDISVSLTAQTVISHYQLKGYLLWWGGAGKH
ncbi:MAG TPA: DsrE family protein [Ferruginibacter sp.]|nr:DsrE family protein [Ferruginibacter sp.]